MLVLTLRKNLTVQGKLPSDLQDFCHHHLVFSNPVYDNFVKIKRFKPDWIAKYIVAYSLRGDTIVLPRGIFDQFKTWLEERGYGYQVRDLRRDVRVDDSFTFAGDDRQYQDETVNLAIRREQATIVLPAGAGKTDTIIQIVSQLSVRTLVLVHKLELIDQWRARIAMRIGEDSGYIQGKHWEEGTLFTIASVQTLARKKLEPEFLKSFGCVVLDEGHHCPATHFRKIVQHFPARFRFAITATPERSDHLEKFMYAVCGRPIETVTTKDLFTEGYLSRPTVVPVHTAFRMPEYERTGEGVRPSVQWHKVAKAISLNGERNQIISSKDTSSYCRPPKDNVHRYSDDKKSWHPSALNLDDVLAYALRSFHNQAHPPSNENFFAGSAIKTQF